MKKLITHLLAAVFATLALLPISHANTGGIHWDKFPEEKLHDTAALQRGAKLFVNYCLNCHAASYMRYNRMHDIGLSDQQIKENLLFAGEKVGDLMKVAIDPRQAKDWFGATPPDLTVIARSRAGEGGTGADYLYTYLRTYYRDDSKATGWNNLAFPSVAMPHVLWELQGPRKAVFEEVPNPHEPGKTETEFKGWEQIKPGKLSALDYDGAVGDLVAYLQWMGEPAQSQRIQLGAWVLMFIAAFAVLAWRLNAAYWKDVK